MNTRVYVENLLPATTESELMELFSRYGNVVGANIAVDQASRRSRGCGLVTMVTSEGAQAAIQALNGSAMGSNILTVSTTPLHQEADRPDGPRRSPYRSSRPDSLNSC